jgi:hypothetical protein
VRLLRRLGEGDRRGVGGLGCGARGQRDN